uniref:Uncharacterized protein n=1 Tax=Arundo donax TaxID=35708 RepID=A0A0A9FYN9_ARUDO
MSVLFYFRPVQFENSCSISCQVFRSMKQNS